MYKIDTKGLYLTNDHRSCKGTVTGLSEPWGENRWESRGGEWRGVVINEWPVTSCRVYDGKGSSEIFDKIPCLYERTKNRVDRTWWAKSIKL